MPAIRDRERAKRGGRPRCRILGPRMISLKIGVKRQHFYVHEDLLCSGSKTFKARLQKNRKDIKGECSICWDGICTNTYDLTFCESCGQNFHRTCVTDWNLRHRSCPLCRDHWPKKSCVKGECIVDMDADSFDLYIQWLYMGRFPFFPEDQDGTANRSIRLIKALAVGENLQDEDFLKAIYTEIFDEIGLTNAKVGSSFVKHAYGQTNGTRKLRALLVDFYAARASPDWMSEATEPFPPLFLSELAQALMLQRKDQPTDMKTFLAKYFLEGEESEEALGEQTENEGTMLLLTPQLPLPCGLE